MSLHKIKEAVQAAEGNARQMGEVVLMIAQADEHAAEVIAADLDNPEMSLQKFFEAFQENSDELAKMRAEVDDDYAFEKLRLRAEDVSRMDIRYYGKLKID